MPQQCVARLIGKGGEVRVLEEVWRKCLEFTKTLKVAIKMGKSTKLMGYSNNFWGSMECLGSTQTWIHDSKSNKNSIGYDTDIRPTL